METVRAMETYKVLLVDDEEEVRAAIAQKLDWAALGFAVVGEADNGEEALEMCEALQPDVIMTDIKMPFMDGLTLCRRAKQVLPGVKLAIFSGFDEFEYAKEAIKLEVEEYILKPIDANELAQVFVRLRQALDTEIAERRDVQRLRHYYTDSLPMMRQQMLIGLLEGRLEASFVRQRTTEYGLELVAGQYCVAVVRHEDADASDGAEPLTAFSLQQLIADILGTALPYRLVHTPDSLVLLFLLGGDVDIRTVIAALNQLFLPAKKLLGTQLSIGVGTIGGQLETLPRSYREALNALEYQILVDPGQCVYIGDIEPSPAGDDFLLTSYAEEIVRQIKIGHRQDLEQAIGQLVSHFKNSGASLQQYQMSLLEIFTELLRLIRIYRLDAEQANLGNVLLEKSFQFNSLDEMGRWLFEYCDSLRRLIRSERKDTTRTTVENAKAYLLEHYQESDLSADVLCAVLSLSPAYFSTIFKKETGLNFVAYLTQLRMEKALELLNTTDDKTYEIAGKVGYADPNYFSYVFKRQYGTSPSKYRTDRMAAHEEDQSAL